MAFTAIATTTAPAAALAVAPPRSAAHPAPLLLAGQHRALPPPLGCRLLRCLPVLLLCVSEHEEDLFSSFFGFYKKKCGVVAALL